MTESHETAVGNNLTEVLRDMRTPLAVSAANEIARLRAESEAMRRALEDARTNICGFNIHNSEQYPETLALFNSEVQRMDKIIRDALAKVTYER